jgi:hypothetical protein
MGLFINPSNYPDNYIYYCVTLTVKLYFSETGYERASYAFLIKYGLFTETVKKPACFLDGEAVFL